jgi:hypothetical protein
MSGAAATKSVSLVATLATVDAIKDLRVLLYTLAAFNSPAPAVYLYCDERVADIAPSFKYPGALHMQKALTRYSGLTRRQMEAQAGRQPGKSLWMELMMEKLNLIEWVFEKEGSRALAEGVLFCDADICFLGPLPQIPTSAALALSPHGIRPLDESKFGRYNGGFLWVADLELVAAWRDACDGARFYEQSALEDVAEALRVAAPAAFYEFPRTQNYGWWRMWQGEQAPETLQREWTMNRMKCPRGVGILLNGEPMGSVHTHWAEQRDRATVVFNQWVLEWIRKLSSAHPPAKKLHAFLQGVLP